MGSMTVFFPAAELVSHTPCPRRASVLSTTTTMVLSHTALPSKDRFQRHQYC